MSLGGAGANEAAQLGAGPDGAAARSSNCTHVAGPSAADMQQFLALCGSDVEDRNGGGAARAAAELGGLQRRTRSGREGPAQLQQARHGGAVGFDAQDAAAEAPVDTTDDEAYARALQQQMLDEDSGRYGMSGLGGMMRSGAMQPWMEHDADGALDGHGRAAPGRRPRSGSRSGSGGRGRSRGAGSRQRRAQHWDDMLEGLQVCSALLRLQLPLSCINCMTLLDKDKIK